MNRIIFGMALAATAFNLGAAQPAPPIPPNWEPILTRPGALAKGSGHVQGFCVTSNAIYATLHDGLYKFDWYGHLKVEGQRSQFYRGVTPAMAGLPSTNGRQNRPITPNIQSFELTMPYPMS